jgi:hypothetical protein
MRSAVLFLVLLGLLSTSCSKQYIPNTDVEENDFNRKVVEFCEEYRHAVERRNVALLLKLADQSYYEDGGNIDATDDLDYAGLKLFLERQFRGVSAVRYEIRYRDVSRGRNDRIFVDFTYSASYKLPTDEGTSVWRRKVADNRLELLEQDDAFKIVAGM